MSKPLPTIHALQAAWEPERKQLLQTIQTVEQALHKSQDKISSLRTQNAHLQTLLKERDQALAECTCKNGPPASRSMPSMAMPATDASAAAAADLRQEANRLRHRLRQYERTLAYMRDTVITPRLQGRVPRRDTDPLPSSIPSLQTALLSERERSVAAEAARDEALRLLAEVVEERRRGGSSAGSTGRTPGRPGSGAASNSTSNAAEAASSWVQDAMRRHGVAAGATDTSMAQGSAGPTAAGARTPSTRRSPAFVRSNSRGRSASARSRGRSDAPGSPRSTVTGVASALDASMAHISAARPLWRQGSIPSAARPIFKVGTRAAPTTDMSTTSVSQAQAALTVAVVSAGSSAKARTPKRTASPRAGQRNVSFPAPYLPKTAHTARLALTQTLSGSTTSAKGTRDGEATASAIRALAMSLLAVTGGDAVAGGAGRQPSAPVDDASVEALASRLAAAAGLSTSVLAAVGHGVPAVPPQVPARASPSKAAKPSATAPGSTAPVPEQGSLKATLMMKPSALAGSAGAAAGEANTGAASAAPPQDAPAMPAWMAHLSSVPLPGPGSSPQLQQQPQTQSSHPSEVPSWMAHLGMSVDEARAKGGVHGRRGQAQAGPVSMHVPGGMPAYAALSGPAPAVPGSSRGSPGGPVIDRSGKDDGAGMRSFGVPKE